MLVRNITFNTATLHFILSVLFFLSGCSALIYQVIWQRELFTLFGVDLESITMIVSIFMFGLGVGGLCGGVIADTMRSSLLTIYAVMELVIGIFGLYSLQIIDAFGHGLLSENTLVTGFVSFVMLSIPTILMGATFPILVTYVNKFDKNIGKSVGKLYFANTLGGALGAYFAGFVFLYSMDIDGAVYCASVLNVTIAISSFMLFRK
jgi:predicted membrane-bound spermidine synthase